MTERFRRLWPAHGRRALTEKMNSTSRRACLDKGDAHGMILRTSKPVVFRYEAEFYLKCSDVPTTILRSVCAWQQHRRLRRVLPAFSRVECCRMTRCRRDGGRRVEKSEGRCGRARAASAAALLCLLVVARCGVGRGGGEGGTLLRTVFYIYLRAEAREAKSHAAPAAVSATAWSSRYGITAL
jgi:hypothetical protein